MADPAGDKPPASSANDHWYDAVTLLTGYKPPVKRGEIFKTLYGNDDIPLMKVEIDTSGASPTNAEVEAINDMAWRARNSGWRINDTDFVVPFYGPTDDSAVSTLPTGTEVHMRRARITLLGTYNHEIPHGGVSYGGKFGAGSHLMPSGFEGWDSAPLAQYSYGGGLALEKLMYDPYTTQGFSFNNVTVNDDDAVDLKSFDKAALAFNRAALFFYNSRATIQQWEDALGSEDAAWRGQAAGVFWDMLHQLGINYQNYTDSLSVGGFGISKVAADLMNAKSGFQKAIEDLYWVWSDWALRLGNPLRWLYDILFDVTDQIWLNNITKVRWHEEYGAESYDSWNQIDEDGWSGDANTGGKSYGPLNALTTWKAIGEEAITKWQKSVDDNLGKAAQDALRAINNSWTHIPDDIPKLTTVQINLQADYQADKAQAAQDKQDKENEENKKKQEEWEKKQEEWREEDKKHQEELEKQQEQQREEDKKHQEELEAEQKKEREEDKKHQEELEKQQEQQREEDKKHQEEIENEQRQQYQQQQEEAKKQYQEQQEQQKQQQDEAKKQYEQQRQDQEAQEKKQEEQQKQQQEEAKKQADEQMAMQLQMRKEDQQKQEEQEKKQEELQKQQQEEAKKQYQEQQQQQKEQQEEAKKQYQQQQADQKAQEAKQEELQKQQQQEAKQQYEQQRQDQQAQEKKQEELQKKQEEQAQKQYDQQQKQAEEQQKQQQQQYEQQQQQQKDIAKEFVQPGHQDLTLPGQQQFVQPGSQLQPSQLTSHVVQNPDGSFSTVFGDGHSGLNSQTGLEHLQPGQIQSHSTLNPDGTITTDFSDGSSTTINPHTGLETTVHPNGTTTHEQLTHGHMLTNPDGSQTTVNPDGTVTTHYPDGSYTTVNPKTGNAVTHEPNGESFTTPLGHDGLSLPGGNVQSPLGNQATSFYEPAVHDVSGSGNLLGGPSGALGGGQGSTPTTFPVGQSGGVLPPATRIDGTTTGGMPPGAQQQSGYPPMMGGGMGGMGGMGMGGGGEKNGNGERVRQVYEDDDIIPSDGGSLGRRARRSRGYEEAVPGANFTPTSSGYNPYGNEDRHQTESGDREREAWAPEEEDVWGTDEGGAPAVIG